MEEGEGVESFKHASQSSPKHEKMHFCAEAEAQAQVTPLPSHRGFFLG